jgi:pSer/pThr/pTyr-binding forkhead associated (FHA) protein
MRFQILRNGSIVDTVVLEERPFWTFGRTPNCDVVMEHPSSSRLHAVLQFKAEDSTAFIYDCGSTHGTFLNKRQVLSPG